MPLPHYSGRQPTPDKEFIYIGNDVLAKEYTWYYGAKLIYLIKNTKYKLGWNSHIYETIEIDGNVLNLNAKGTLLIEEEFLIPISLYRQKRIDEILEN